MREFHYFIREGKDQKAIYYLKTEINEESIIKNISQNGQIDGEMVRVVINEIGFGLT